MTTSTAPLESYRIVGLRENWHQPAPGAPKRPGGGCWHCGTGIAIEVVIRHVTTGEEHTIGTTCAERVGLDPEALKRLLADRYAEQRELARQMRSAEYREMLAQREADETAAFGEHGTETRFESGCRCNPCIAAAPHGTDHRFWHGACRCLTCIDHVLATDPNVLVMNQDVIVNVDTGEVVTARKVDTRYGYRWCVEDGRAWLPIGPKRRDTQAKKGYVEASAPYVVERIKAQQGGHWYKLLVRVGDPIVDIWDEPIARPA